MQGIEHHPTPGAAALATWASCPSAQARVVSVEVRGDEAHVVIDTDPSYPDFVVCRRTDAGWTATVSGNGPSAWDLDGEPTQPTAGGPW